METETDGSCRRAGAGGERGLVNPETPDRVAALAAEFGLASLEPLIDACRAAQGSGLDVAVVGRFKAGKSSLLNRLAGRELLPVGVLPVTAVVVRLTCGAEDRAVARFLDGSARDIPLAELDAFASERGNPRNEKGVASVEVFLPSLSPLAPLSFVDTPGLGSALAHNDAATMKWLPKVGTAVVAVSCDAPLAEQDLVLLDELRRHTPRIDLLLTKADLLDEAQRGEVLDFVRRELRRRWGAEPPVRLYSVKPSCAELATAFERDLLRPLARDHARARAEVARHKAAALLDRALDGLRVALAAAESAQASRDALRRALAAERGALGLLREELQAPAAREAERALGRAHRALAPLTAALGEELRAALRAELARWPRSLPPLLAAWRSWLNDALAARLAEESRKFFPAFLAPARTVEESLRRSLEAQRHRLAEEVRRALGVELPARAVVLETPARTAPPVRIGFVDAAFVLISPLVPMRLFGPWVERWLMRRTRWEAEKNLSRLASDWSVLFSESVRALAREAERQALLDLSLLEQALDSEPARAPCLRAAIAELKRRRAAL
jgi:GTP-binding protein EngB required for normal cell division